MDCIDAGKMLQEEGYHPAVLNMACEDGPGGGVIGGCYGQEESLFRRSNLYVYLYPYSPHALECNLQSKHPQYPLNGNFDGIYVRDAVISGKPKIKDMNCFKIRLICLLFLFRQSENQF